LVSVFSYGLTVLGLILVVNQEEIKEEVEMIEDQDLDQIEETLAIVEETIAGMIVMVEEEGLVVVAIEIIGTLIEIEVTEEVMEETTREEEIDDTDCALTLRILI